MKKRENKPLSTAPPKKKLKKKKFTNKNISPFCHVILGLSLDIIKTFLQCFIIIHL